MIESETFVGLTSLTNIWIRNNKLKVIESNSFVDNINLRCVDLKFNNLDSVSNHSFVFLSKSLEFKLILMINFNKIEKIDNFNDLRIDLRMFHVLTWKMIKLLI